MSNIIQVEQHSLARSIVLHLWPGAIFTLFLILTIPALESVGVDPIFALFGGIGLVLVPIELAYLAAYARHATGYWSPLKAVEYKERLSRRHIALFVVVLTVWFFIWLIISIALLDTWLARNAFSWLPENLLQFSFMQSEEGSGTGITVASFILIAFLFNGIAGPITEELYFRGHLLPRLERFGIWAPLINTCLFATYHFFSPWRYPAIIIGFLPITWIAWRKRSVYVSMAAHMTINNLTNLLLVASLANGR